MQDVVPKLVMGQDGCPSKTLNPKQDWKSQIRNRIKSVDELELFLGFELGEDVRAAAGTFPMAITPYYASLIRTPDQTDPVFRMAVPSAGELIQSACLSEDPLSEEEDSPVHGLVHRYKDRALLVTTSMCGHFCRYCVRKRVTGQKESTFCKSDLDKWVAYLREHPEIKDVIVSGGDPLTMPTEVLDGLLTAIRAVPSVEIVRIGTRVPVVMPMRVDEELVTMLKKHHPLYINTHFNHPNEITVEAKRACEMLANGGIPMGNQSVLLKGVNDDSEVMETLCRALVRMRCRPYYLFVADKVMGTSHFQTKVEDGIAIMEHLRGRVGGLAIPSLIVDLPNGGGKVPLLPNYIEKVEGDTVFFRSPIGGTVEYHNGQ